jgi:hypothetical protein
MKMISRDDAQRKARRQVTRARIAATRIRAESKARASAKVSGMSSKAIGAAGAAGLAAGYFLDPDSGTRRRNGLRDRVLGIIRRGERRSRGEADYVTGSAEGKIETS